jgi:hypothetical protein
MINDTPSNNAISMEARVTKVGEAISDGVQSTAAATAAVAGHAQPIVSDAAATTTAAAGQATKVLGNARVKRRSVLGPKRAPWQKML